MRDTDLSCLIYDLKTRQCGQHQIKNCSHVEAQKKKRRKNHETYSVSSASKVFYLMY